jgi:hypothetical protein
MDPNSSYLIHQEIPKTTYISQEWIRYPSHYYQTTYILYEYASEETRIDSWEWILYSHS